MKKTTKKISNKFVTTDLNLVAPVLLKFSILITPIAFLLIFFLPSYFPFTAGNIMVFSGSDGNCVAGELTFGTHCFGDYGVPINFIRDSGNPWSTGSILGQFPPLNMILMSIFAFISNSVNNAIAVAIYLMTILYSVLFPIIHATRKFSKSEQRMYVLYLGVLSMPLIAALDRGNNLVWSIPFVYLALVSILRNRYNNAIIFLSFAIAIRPQHIIFILLFLISRRYLSILKTCILTLVIYLLSFVIYLKRIDLESMVNYFKTTKQYGSGIPGNWPPNISLARGIKVFLEWFSIKQEDSTIILIASAIIFCSLACIYFLRENLKMRAGTILLIPIVFLSAPMTWYYYGTFLVIAVAIFIGEDVSIDDLFIQKSLSYLFVGGIILTNTVLFIPILNDYNNIVQYLVPVYWLFFYISFIAQSLILFITNGKNRVATK